MNQLKYKHLFEPITLGKTVFRNRIFASPTGFQNGDHLCLPSKELIAYYELKALGGAASVTMGDCLVDSQNGRVTKVEFPLDDPDQKGPLASLCKAITRHGAVASVELQHGGMYARTSGERLGYLWGPSGMMLPFRPGGSPQVKTDGTFIEVREMTEEMIGYTISRFGDAALFAKQRGFGMVMVHGGHGWLVSQFMSDRTNQRKDRWGGSLENRMRFPLAIIDDIRRKCGRDFPIEFRMSGSECNSEGYDIDEGIELAKALDGKVDLLHVSAGNHEIFDVFFVTHPSMFHEDGCNVKYAAEVKKHVKTPVATVGALTDPGDDGGDHRSDRPTSSISGASCWPIPTCRSRRARGATTRSTGACAVIPAFPSATSPAISCVPSIPSSATSTRRSSMSRPKSKRRCSWPAAASPACRRR
jgi:2,4-dienoyl-CoA reductase-like NADH-dependent reductase (Old Yellow Enzyme family)